MATKQEILSKLAASHEQRISKVLFDLEEDIIAQLQRATDGVPLTTELAIQLRPNLKQLIEQNYLKEGSKIISEYDEVVKGYMDYIRTTPVSDKFKTLTKPDLVLINQLKQLSFSGFEDVANRFLDTIATEIYSSAVTGKPFPQVVENIRASINGVYRRSNEAAVNRLVSIVEENRYSDDPIAKKKYLDARKILHSKYASDIRGENMRKYASQIAHDSIMQFDGQFTKYKGQEAGINTYKYTGTNITTTRQFCRANLNEIKSEEEWRDVFTGNWRGKSGSDPFVNRGGYRCRHSLIPYDPAWDAEEKVKQKVNKIKDKTTITKSSYKNPIKKENINVVSAGIIQTELAKRIVKNANDKKYPRFDDGEYPIRFYNSLGKDGKVSLFGLNDKAASFVASIMDEIDELCDDLKIPRIRGISTTNDAIAMMGDGILYLNPKYFNDFIGTTIKRVSNYKLGTYKITSRRKVLGQDVPHNAFEYFEDELDKIRNTIYHELGHHVSQYLNANLENYKKLGMKYYMTYRNGYKRVRGKIYSTRYMLKETEEWNAENFSLYHMNRKDLVDPKWIKYYEEQIK